MKRFAVRGHAKIRLIAAAAIFAGICLIAASPAPAGEVWIAPAKADQDKKFGNWAVANLGGETHFSFRVPSDMGSFTRAKVVLIPSEDGPIAYDLHFNRTQNSGLYTDNSVDVLGNEEYLFAGTLTEIDVTPAFNGVAAQDYVSLNFVLPHRRASTQVLGLRFEYEGGGGGTLDGDVTGPLGGNMVVGLRGTPLASVAPSTQGQVLTFDAAAGAWVPGFVSIVSDRRAKENVREEHGEQVLIALAGIPIQSWNYRWNAPTVRHLGPMAQDFRAAFGLGENDTQISPIDLGGVSLLAIQALEKRTVRLRVENESLHAMLTTLRQETADLKARLEYLEQVAHPREGVAQIADLR